MFLTFKPSGRGSARNGSGMRQVAAAHAGLGPGRRAACVNCQKKKIRCTGDVDTCDDCRACQIACVRSDEARRKRARTQKGGSKDLGRRSANASTSAKAFTPGSRTQESQVPQPPDPQFADWERLLREPTLHGENTRPAQPSEPVAPYGLGVTLLDTPPGSLPYEPLDTVPFPEDHALGNVPEGLSFITPPGAEPNGGPSCECMDSILGIVQKLDDDEFHLRSLSVDQVLKLQKWIVFKCLAPLQCQQCGHDARTQSTILVICERMVEMFQCLSTRLTRLHQGFDLYVQRNGIGAFEILQLPESLFDSGTPLDAPPPGDHDQAHDTTARLYDGVTGEAGVSIVCTIHLFSEDFRAQYSGDEQCRMIGVLLRMQIDNCARLLQRLGSLSASQPARSGKIRAMERRLRDLEKTAGESLEAISLAFSRNI